jgi:hypothetical protein
MNFTTIFMEGSLLLWLLVIAVAHNIWSVWYSTLNHEHKILKAL